MGSQNSLVRVLAGRLLVDMVLATGGNLPADGGEERPISRTQDSSNYSAADTSQMEIENDHEDDDPHEDWEEEVEDVNDDEEEEVAEENDDQESISGQSRAPTEVASVCTIISITGVDPVVAMKVREFPPEWFNLSLVG